VTAGAILGAAAIRVPVVVDGTPGRAAHALAVALAPAANHAAIVVDGSGDGLAATAHFLQLGLATRLVAELP
jgi:NaMN:DMB phosphoribosyltransferase